MPASGAAASAATASRSPRPFPAGCGWASFGAAAGGSQMPGSPGRSGSVTPPPKPRFGSGGRAGTSAPRPPGGRAASTASQIQPQSASSSFPAPEPPTETAGAWEPDVPLGCAGAGAVPSPAGCAPAPAPVASPDPVVAWVVAWVVELEFVAVEPETAPFAWVIAGLAEGRRG